jgi:hypothetical protein
LRLTGREFRDRNSRLEVQTGLPASRLILKNSGAFAVWNCCDKIAGYLFDDIAVVLMRRLREAGGRRPS